MAPTPVPIRDAVTTGRERSRPGRMMGSSACFSIRQNSGTRSRVSSSGGATCQDSRLSAMAVLSMLPRPITRAVSSTDSVEDAGPVERLLCGRDRRGQQPDGAGDEDGGDRQIDQEEPVPPVGQQQAAHDGADDERQAEDRAQHAECRSPLLGRQGVADHRGGDGEDPAAAEALDRPSAVEHGRVPGDHEQQRAGGEEADADDIGQAGPDPVGELGQDRRADHLAQHVGIEQHGQLAGGHAEVRLDRRQGRADDRQVEGAHQHAGEQERQQPA